MKKQKYKPAKCLRVNGKPIMLPDTPEMRAIRRAGARAGARVAKLLNKNFPKDKN